MRKLHIAFLLLIPLVPSCVAVGVGVGAGVLLSQDVLDAKTYVGHLDVDADRTWSSTKISLSHMSLKPIDVNNELRTATADVDGAKVTASVETYDLNQSLLKVYATKYGVENGEIAKVAFDKILSDLKK